jgi:hypothetical protein
MAVGIAKLDRHLGAGASPAVKIDRHPVFLEIIPGAKHVVDGRDFEREMMQFTLPGDFSASLLLLSGGKIIAAALREGFMLARERFG